MTTEQSLQAEIRLGDPQENANLEDIVRFFGGYELMGNPVTILKQVSLFPFSHLFLNQLSCW